MRKSATITREQLHRREAKAARRRTRKAKGRRSPANERLRPRPASRIRPVAVTHHALQVSPLSKRQGFFRHLSVLNPFKDRALRGGRPRQGGGHRG